MKKLVLTTVLAIFTVVSLSAQTSFGVKAGVNFSSINGDEADSFDGRTGFHVGGVVDISVSDNFSVQPEVLYSAQGADYSDEMYSGSYKLDYLNVPVMAKFRVGEGFNVEVGPQFGFLLSAKDEYDSSGGDSGEDDVKDYTKSVDFSANVGLNYKLESGLNFGARYTIGLSELNDFGDMSEYMDVKWKNNAFQVYLGFFFN